MNRMNQSALESSALTNKNRCRAADTLFGCWTSPFEVGLLIIVNSGFYTKGMLMIQFSEGESR